MSVDDTIITPRLELRLIPRPVLEALAAEAYDEVPYDVAVEELQRLTWVAGYRVRQLDADASVAPWLLRTIVLRGGGAVAGHVGLHGPPDDDGVVEIGYTVFEPYRRRGLAEEAARGLLEWAAGRGVRRVRASVSPTNVPSLRMVAKLGFVEVDRVWDDEDGEEIVFEGPLPLG